MTPAAKGCKLFKANKIQGGSAPPDCGEAEFTMKKKAFRAALPCTLPVLMGYIFLGIAFGVLLAGKGFSPLWALLMSVCIYAGSMQFVAISIMTAAFSPLTSFFMTIMVNARHLFYGLSMLEPFRDMGKLKPYMIFSLTDETYSLLCGIKTPEGVDRKWFLFFISLLDQLYWVAGSCIGAIAGNLIPFDSTGIDFAMTALFLVIFVEQWETASARIATLRSPDMALRKKVLLSVRAHLPALSGIVITAVCLLFFGANNFLLFSMAGILAALLLFQKQCMPDQTAAPKAKKTDHFT